MKSTYITEEACQKIPPDPQAASVLQALKQSHQSEYEESPTSPCSLRFR